MIWRFLAVLHARNLEFVRDRSSVGWNIVLPVLLVFGLAFIFSGSERPMFKVAVLNDATELDKSAHPFLSTRYIQFFKADDVAAAVRNVSRHRIDMLVDLRDQKRYWVNSESAKGYLLEKLLRASGGSALQRAAVTGQPVRYAHWLLPGILGMNIMFSCLFGVGYVVVRYRKNGFLKRLQATPLRAIEFLGAQVASRIFLILAVSMLVYLGTSYFIGFQMEGSYFDLLLITILGATSMVAMGLVVAARVSSEELAGGLLNLISWPMMLLSGVWFSMEGSHPFLQQAAKLLPLTHLLDGARAIMIDGAGLSDVFVHLAILALMSAAFLIAGAALFRWHSE